MKRFLAFTYNDYYPLGPKDDLCGDFDTIEEAIKHEQEDDFGRPLEYENLSILDTQIGGWLNLAKPYGRGRDWMTPELAEEAVDAIRADERRKRQQARQDAIERGDVDALRMMDSVTSVIQRPIGEKAL